MNYDKPTYKSYDNNAEQWLEWKRQAHAIGYDEARRHASVSINNQHKCHECFCCACWEYKNECDEAGQIKVKASYATDNAWLSDNQGQGAQPSKDYSVENQGTIVLFRPLTPEAEAHLRENVQEDAQWFGGALVVEHRYAAPLANQLVDDGFEVKLQ